MKKIKLLSVILALVLCVCLFVACDPKDDGGNDEKPSVAQYTLTFDLDGGSMTSTSVTVGENTTVDLSKYVPAKENCEFAGWTLDGTAVTSVAVTGNITVKATWEVVVKYEENEEQTAYVLTYIKGKENLVLPETYNSKPVTSVKATAIGNADVVKTLVIGNSYTAIEEGTLSALKNLESLSVPFVKSNNDFAKLFEKVETMPENCYEVKVGSDKYAIPNALVSLSITGGDAVPDLSYGKFRFENLVVASDEIVTFEAGVIRENDYLKSVDISGCKNITKIGGSNFQNCVNLKTVDISGLGKLEVLGEHCFYYYKPGTNETWNVDSIDMSGLDSLKVTGQMCFWYVKTDTLDFSETAIEVFGRQNVFHCTVKNVKLPVMLNLNLTEAQIKAYESEYNMPELDNSEFLGYIGGLESITVNVASPFLSSENGALYDFDKTVVIKYANKDAKSYVAPSTLKVIKPNAFENATVLKTVDLTACELDSIGGSAFSGCNAALTVGFDRYGYYATTGKKVTLGNNWNGGCNVTYGTRYLFFDITANGITDNMTVATDTVDFTVTAKYGDDAANAVVKVNGAEIAKGENGYTASLNEGANTIEIIAFFGDKTSDTMTYTITKDSKWVLKTSLKDGQKVVWANGNLIFTVWAENAAGEKQNIEDLVKIYIDCGYNKDFIIPGTGLSIAYSIDGAEVTLNSSKLLGWDYDITKAHHIKVEVQQSESITLEKIFNAQYYEKAPEIVSETPTTGNTVSDDWTIELQCTMDSTVMKIVSIEAMANQGGTQFVTTSLSSDGTTATVKLAVSILARQFWIDDGDTLKITVNVTLENGLTVEITFNATYEG